VLTRRRLGAVRGGRPPRAILLAALGILLLLTLLAAQGSAAAEQTAPRQSPAQLARADELPLLQQIGVPAAWRISRGKHVLVGVLDTGVNPDAPGLTGQVISGPDFTRGADPPGYHPPHLHGTYIASIIAGHGSGAGRRQGILGVAPEARVLSVRVILDDNEPGFSVYQDNSNFYDAIGNGIRYAVAHGVQVINMSLGTPLNSRDMRSAIAYAVAHGVVVVSSAGNSGHAGSALTPYSYPASTPGVVSVAALGPDVTRASFSNQNSAVVMAAPGVRVPGDGPRGSYILGSGTSPASALVAGVAALIRSRYPKLPPALVVQALVSSTSHRPAGGYSPSVGFGEVNAAAALAAAARLASQHASPVKAPGSHFGARPGAIVVVHHDYRMIAMLLGLAIVMLAACLILVGSAIRRSRRPPAPPVGGAGMSGAWY
jgi:subtilisin family serine protease